MIAAEAVITKKKLKIKFGTQRIEVVAAARSCEYGQQVTVVENWHHKTSGNESKQLEMSKSHPSSDSKRMFASASSKERPLMLAGNKREAQDVIEGPKDKRRKMDRGLTHQCSILLKSLMAHPAGWVFNQPVDPVKLNIPDYFSIISKPMDLGTIKTKLNKNMYYGTEEFVADVRLTFSNAMLYNPPENNVHKMAEELNDLFLMKWKSLEDKWTHERPKAGMGKVVSGKMMEVNDTVHNSPKTPPLHNSLSSKKSKTGEERAVRNPSYTRDTEVERPRPLQSCSNRTAGKHLQKGTDGGGRRACGIANKPPLSPVACKKCGKCDSTTCRCNLPSDSTHASSSDITSERSLGGDHRACSADASKLDCQAKSTSTSQTSKSDPDPDSDGAVSALDDGNLCPSSQLTPPATDSASAEDWTASFLGAQMSPKKALRAAMLKSRFADTILKAQQRTLLDHGDKADPVKLQLEKERLERRQREEKARIEAQIQAAEAASRMKAEIELKRQREKEREAARIALQKMERTVEIEHNLEILKELEMLTGFCLSPHLLEGDKGSAMSKRAFKGPNYENPLERIGLFMKNDYLGDDDEEILNLNGDGEEGEIF
ncbi:transcription factor GTE10 isoform X1 [Pistacia vera]|uniref:transcription factor GTE10 isoform X1 n=1 Tax=Pistacia vera TaxID=55513 RepID=UPI001262C1E0|nr:transcription factor GTE10 isoform X1 [Pistacia vera]XP_031256800.1 transcription factor GTE10 isoform X1 [Pistacia vera]XP_031256801.1 transcription factor GTE10 isoform X1 [Pistacia vera]